MNVIMAVACDSAVEYAGRLCVLGTFDTIAGTQLPIVKPHCSLVVQIQWDKSDEGRHRIQARFMNEDGSRTLNDLESAVQVTIPDPRLFLTTNHIINLQQLKFHQAGTYLIAVVVDDQTEAEIHIQVQSGKLPPADPPPSGPPAH